MATVPVMQACISIIESETRPWCDPVHLRVSPLQNVFVPILSFVGHLRAG